jgi:hypothetical protein
MPAEMLVRVDFRFEPVVVEDIGKRGLEGFGALVHSGIVAPYLVHIFRLQENTKSLNKGETL